MLFLGTFLSCSQVLQTVQLKVDESDKATQEEFNVVAKTLTVNEARKQNMSPYERTILQFGTGENARSIPEKLAIQSNFPLNDLPIEYKIGIGDTLSLSKLIENNRSIFDEKTQWPKEPNNFSYKLGIGDTLILTLLQETTTLNQRGSSSEGDNQSAIYNSQKSDATITSIGSIGSDGSVLLLKAGSLMAKGKTLIELRSEVRNVFIRNGISPRFQLEIEEFRSQKAFLTINDFSEVIILNNQKTTLRDILTEAGVGFKPGTITFVRLQRDDAKYLIPLRSIFKENIAEITIKDRDHIFVEDTAAELSTTISTVGNDGNIVLASVGKIKAAGLSLNELRAKISSLMTRLPDSENVFQIEITKFQSQNAIVNIVGQSVNEISITNNPITLSQALSQSTLSVEENKITRIDLKREDRNYLFTLDELLRLNSNKLYLQPNDVISIETLPYKENKVYILGGVNPQIFKINPAKRETLADVLFTSGGPLSASSANRSEVYLLRGNNPVYAYHLDARSPTRLIVADAMELRPNDILYVAEQPIISFNRALATIIPLRILLRDIQDENIP